MRKWIILLGLLNLFCINVINAKQVTIPEEFREYYYDAPLIVRVEKDSLYLADMSIILTRSNNIRILSIVDSSETQFNRDEVFYWEKQLSTPRQLGKCEKDCVDGLIDIDFSIKNSLLSIVTKQGSKTAKNINRLPEDGRFGLISNNRINLFGSEHESYSGRLNSEFLGSIKNWTYTSSYLANKSSNSNKLQHYLYELYLSRELTDNTLNVGYINPTHNGVYRVPSQGMSGSNTLLGVQLSSSSNLRQGIEMPALYPVYVTADRPSIVEVYRNDILIYSQPVNAGLQHINTERLPSGIYDVELRIMEDGQQVFSSQELIYKPVYWGNLDSQWQYDIFTGFKKDISSDHSSDDKGGVFGGAVNWLAHPTTVLGLQYGKENGLNHISTSVDWHLKDNVSLYSSGYHRENYGYGYDIQGMMRFNRSSVILNYSDKRMDGLDGNITKRVESASVNYNHNFYNGKSLSSRTTYYNGAYSGIGQDLSFNLNANVFDTSSVWRVGVFNRPGQRYGRSVRNKGAELSFSFSFGGNSSRRLNGNFVSRSSNGASDENYGSLTVTQDFDQSVVQSLSGTLSSDGKTLGYGFYSELANDNLRGDIYGQNSTFDNYWSGGLNLETSYSVSDFTLTSVPVIESRSSKSGLIIDVQSETDKMDVVVTGDSGFRELEKGKNYIGVNPWKRGRIHFSFPQDSTFSGKIVPAYIDYNLNKGEVNYHAINIMKTVTLLGRIKDKNDQALKGIKLKNHIGETYSEHDGTFILEVSSSEPAFDIYRDDILQCSKKININEMALSDGIILVGNISCNTQ